MSDSFVQVQSGQAQGVPRAGMPSCCLSSSVISLANWTSNRTPSISIKRSSSFCITGPPIESLEQLLCA